MRLAVMKKLTLLAAGLCALQLGGCVVTDTIRNLVGTLIPGV